MQVPTSASRYYRRTQRLQALTIAAVRREWAKMQPGDRYAPQIAESVGPKILALIVAAQSTMLSESDAYQAAVLTELGIAPDATEGVVDPVGFLGYAGDGREIAGLIGQAAVVSGEAYVWSPAGADRMRASQDALAVGGRWIDMATQTLLADTGRAATSAALTSQPRVTGYTRMLNPPSCSRCAVLAGRRYRWNEGFRRHPRCDCRHIPTAESVPDVTTDPYQYFRSLLPADQDRHFTKAGAQAIRDGADISQVVNARRGMTANGNFTLTGTTKRGNASLGLKRGQRRMMPELIYEQANGDRVKAMDLLVEHGFILPRGQLAEGALVGQREGFGQLGAGGRRKAASAAVQQARETGVRDPANRYTMTAAERRLYDAGNRYRIALEGRDPYSSPGFGNTPDPSGLGLNTVGARPRPSTPEQIEQLRKTYLYWLARDGQFYA